MGEQNKPQEGKPLTAEHLWGLNSRLIPASESECVPHDDIIAMEHDEFISCVEQYAAQETAALREELEKYKRGDKIWSGMYDSISHELEKYKQEIERAGNTVISASQLSLLVNGIEAKDSLIEVMDKKLEAVKKERAELQKLLNEKK